MNNDSNTSVVAVDESLKTRRVEVALQGRDVGSHTRAGRSGICRSVRGTANLLASNTSIGASGYPVTVIEIEEEGSSDEN